MLALSKYLDVCSVIEVNMLYAPDMKCTIANELLLNSTSVQQQYNAEINERSHVFYN